MENKHKRKARGLLFLPLLVIPFLTLAFWTFGGGKAMSPTQTGSSGLNVQLPDAHFKNDGSLTKLSFYEKQKRDSVKIRETVTSDPLLAMESQQNNASEAGADQILSEQNSGQATSADEQKIYRKLAELRRQLASHSPAPEEAPWQSPSPPGDGPETGSSPLGANSLQQQASRDPEIEQLNSMMEKIIDIQHPERLEEKLHQAAERRRQPVFPLTPLGDDPSIFTLQEDTGKKVARFFSEDQGTSGAGKRADAIEATVCGASSIVSGATVKMRLLQESRIGGVVIASGQFIYGIASLTGERLDITVKSIRYHNSIFPVSLSVYDMDGLKGIYTPESVTRKAALQSGERALQRSPAIEADPSVGMQAAGMGIEAARNILTKKARMPKVSVRDGYRVLLADDNPLKQ